MKALSLHYQRNGVAGEGFFQFMYKHKYEGDKEELTFLATFDTKGDEPNKVPFIDWVTCRVTSIDKPELAWRGDRISSEIQGYLYKTFGEPDNTSGNLFYDLIEKVNKK